MTGGSTMNYARVTDFRHEATGQISGVVVKEAAKQISRANLKPKGSSSRDSLTRFRRARVVVPLLILST